MEGAAYSAICDATYMSWRAIRVVCPEAQEGKYNKQNIRRKTKHNVCSKG
jgi:nucleoside phosphorylase